VSGARLFIHIVFQLYFIMGGAPLTTTWFVAFTLLGEAVGAGKRGVIYNEWAKIMNGINIQWDRDTNEVDCIPTTEFACRVVATAQGLEPGFDLPLDFKFAYAWEGCYKVQEGDAVHAFFGALGSMEGMLMPLEEPGSRVHAHDCPEKLLMKTLHERQGADEVEEILEQFPHINLHNVTADPISRITPLMAAMGNNDQRIADLLLENRKTRTRGPMGKELNAFLARQYALGIIDAVDSMGYTALVHAVMMDSTTSIHTLIERGANVEHRFTMGAWHECTPLMFAVEHGHLRATEALLEGNADVLATARNAEGVERPVLDFVKNEDMRDLLKGGWQYGVCVHTPPSAADVGPRRIFFAPLDAPILRNAHECLLWCRKQPHATACGHNVHESKERQRCYHMEYPSDQLRVEKVEEYRSSPDGESNEYERHKCALLDDNSRCPPWPVNRRITMSPLAKYKWIINVTESLPFSMAPSEDITLTNLLNTRYQNMVYLLTTHPWRSANDRIRFHTKEPVTVYVVQKYVDHTLKAVPIGFHVFHDNIISVARTLHALDFFTVQKHKENTGGADTIIISKNYVCIEEIIQLDKWIYSIRIIWVVALGQ